MENQRKDVEESLINTKREITGLLTQWQAVQSRKPANEGRTKGEYFVTHPSLMWSSVLQGDSVSKDDEVALAIEMAAAKLMAGDLAYVMESGLGQIAWLSALAVEMRAASNNSNTMSSKKAYLDLALRAQGAAAKLMLSLGALGKM